MLKFVGVTGIVVVTFKCFYIQYSSYFKQDCSDYFPYLKHKLHESLTSDVHGNNAINQGEIEDFQVLHI